jgi:magnesium-transporting ATPase (P-type)
VRALKEMGIQRVVMLTGDNRRVAAAIAQQAGLDEFHADLLPEDKVRVLKSLEEIGPVAMVATESMMRLRSRPRRSALRWARPAQMSQWRPRMSC